MFTLQSSNPAARFVRFFCLAMVSLFYPRVELRGGEKLPPAGTPTLFVLNHPNGLIDPMIVMLAVQKPVSFLAKSTFWGNPLGRFLMNTFGALPAFRKQDEGLGGGPKGDAAARNEETFAQCRYLLNRGGLMALCPEGTTHSEPMLKELRTGAARIALTTEAEARWSGQLTVVPVGLWYQNKRIFRSAVLMVVGEPFTLVSYRQLYEQDAYQAAHQLTDQIDQALDEVVLQAEENEALLAAPYIADWTAPEGPEQTLAQQHEWSKKLLQAYQFMKERDPGRVQKFIQAARRYALALERLGIDDPWELEIPAVTQGKMRRLVAAMVILAPLALLGFLLSYLPYRVVGPLADRAVQGDHTQTSTVKLVGGTMIMLVAWGLEGAVVGWLLTPLWGMVTFGLCIPLGYLALLWGEAYAEWQELLAYRLLNVQEERLVQTLKAERESLAAEAQAAVREMEVATSGR